MSQTFKTWKGTLPRFLLQLYIWKQAYFLDLLSYSEQEDKEKEKLRQRYHPSCSMVCMYVCGTRGQF